MGELSDLQGAIDHIDDLLERDAFSCEECRCEHVQLREWLVELQETRQRRESMEEAFCPMMGVPCRDDCAWARNITEVDGEGFLDSTICAIAYIGAWCVLDIQGDAEDVYFDTEEDDE